MSLDISFAQFDAISSGKYNAGQIDYKGKGDGISLKKVNAHVHAKGLNVAVVDAGRTVELKRAFVKAVATRLDGDANAISEIRKSLGLPPDDSNPKALNQRTIEPLTRQEVRAIIDKYVNGGNAGAVDGDVAAKRDEVNVANQRALPIRIDTQTFRLDSMAEELSRASKCEPSKGQAAFILKFLTRPDGKLDAATFARAMNLFSYIAEQAAAKDAQGGRNAGARLDAAFSRALDSLDNGTLSQVYQGLISREAEGLKSELWRRLETFDLSAEQADVCERTALAIGRLEALVLSEISHRVALGQATTEQERTEIAAQAPVFRHCGPDVARDLSARNNAGEMTGVNLEIIATRAAYGNIHEKDLAGKTTGDLVKLGFTQADTHDIGNAMRSCELTVNARLSNLLGWREGQDSENPPLFQPGYALVNTFVSKEQKGMPMNATSYLVRRNEIERHFFPEYGKTSEFRGRDRPNYAALNTAGSTGGAAPSYGGVVFVMKEHVKQQATYTLSDTFYAVKFDFREGAKAKFLAKAQHYFADLVKPEALEQLADKSTNPGKWVDVFFKLQEREGIATGKGFETMTQVMDIANFLNDNRSPDVTREIGADDMMAVLFDAIGVRDAEAARVAGYDNIENLLADMQELDPLVVGLSTARRMADPDAPVSLAGGEYIEAQLHGPIVVSRDVAEMRVPRPEIESHYRGLANRNPTIMNGMDKQAWIAQQTQIDVDRLLQFGKDNGFKVTIYEMDDDNADKASANLGEDIKNVKAMMHDEHAAFVRDLVDNHVKELMNDAFTELYDKWDLAAELFGDRHDSVPPWLENAVRSSAAKAMEVVDDLKGTDGYQKDVLRQRAAGFVREALEVVMDCVTEARQLGVDDKDQAFALAKETLDAGLVGSRAKNYVAAQIAFDRITANPQAIIKETLENELAARSEEIAALGLPDGFTLEGAALERILSNVQGHLARFQRSGAGMQGRQRLIDDIREKVIAPEIAGRLDLLKSIDANSFPDENMKKSYFGWVMGAKRIKSAEELTGVKNSSEGFYNAFSNLLSQETDFDAPAFMAALQDMKTRLAAAIAADNAANYQGDGEPFGTDDRNGYITRCISVGLGAIKERMGDHALEKLARILAKPEFTGLLNAMTVVVGLAADPGARLDSTEEVPLDFLANAHLAILRRLTTKYHLVSGPALGSPIDYSQVPPDVRSLLALEEPDFVATLDARIPYAPQTTKPMPVALNPDGAPKTLAARKRALMGALPAYRAHEQDFDRGRNTHGRGHATRVFIFANALGNIMRERGVKVDMGSLSLSAAGHDMGRKGGGTDVWEAESAQLVSQLAETVYPGVYGEDWKAQTSLNVAAGHGAEADGQRSVEGLLFKAADSLDYTRVNRLDVRRFHFLEMSLNVDGVNVMQDDNLRRALMHEAELLTKATSPLAEKREQIIRLKASETEAESLRGQILEDEVTDAETALSNLDDEQLVAHIEKEIRDNPAKYPLLTKYYLNAE